MKTNSKFSSALTLTHADERALAQQKSFLRKRKKKFDALLSTEKWDADSQGGGESIVNT